MTEHRLFSYGTLQQDTVQQQVLGRTVQTQPATLSGYCLDWNIFPPYPVAVPDDDAQAGPIEGLVLQIQETDLPHLDAYEGAAYLRVDVTLDSGMQAWVYVGNPLFNATDTP